MELILSLFNNIIPFVVVITILVFVHEAGHFLVARLNGIKVEVFSIGFGKELFGFNDKYNTRWKFCLIPMGGYVKMFGDKNSASQSDDDFISQLSEDEKKVAFSCKSLSAKAAVVIAGPLANYLFSTIIFTCFFVIYGNPTAKPIVTKVVEHSPASLAGIENGDLITFINGQAIENFNDISNIMNLNVGEEVNIELIRNNNVITKKIVPKVFLTKDIIGSEVKSFKLGIAAEQVFLEKQNIFSAVKLAITECFNLSYMSLKAIGQIINGTRSAKEMGGPIKIAQYSSKSAEYGLQSLIWLIALLSVNLGLINLLPIPVLDGGHLLIYAAEFVFGTKIAKRMQDFGFQIGLILLIMITMFVTYNDLSSLNLFTHKG